MSNFMTVFALCILGCKILSWLVFLFSTSHALSLHPWGFSRLMTRIRRSLCSRIILSLILSITSVLFVALGLVDVCIDIYVMMSSDLYGMCRCQHCVYGTLSLTCGRNCNPFGNVATITASCKMLHWQTMQTSFTVPVISFILSVVICSKIYRHSGI